MDISVALAYSAAAVNALSFGYYTYLTVRGGIKPNAATWFVYALVGVLNFLTYRSLAGDPVKTYVVYVGVVANSVVFVSALLLRRFKALTKGEAKIVIAAVGALVLWVVNPHAPYANAVVMICIIMSTWPTFINPDKEPAVCWFGFLSANIITLTVVILRWQKIWDLMFPLTCILINGSVAFATVVRERRKAEDGAQRDPTELLP